MDSQCLYCKITDEKVIEFTIWQQDWRGKRAICVFHAHKDCHLKETSTNGDGHGVWVTA